MDLTVKDAARLLHTSEKTIYRWVHDGTLPSYRLDDHYRLNRVELLEWATARNIKVSPEIFSEEHEALPPGLLTGAVRAGGIFYGIPGGDKPTVLRVVCDRIPLPSDISREDLYGVILAREALGSTAIGRGIAIPHPRSPLILGVKTPAVSLAFLERPVDFGALDRQDVSVLFTIISTTIRIHLQLLSRLMAVLQEPGFAALLKARASQERILAELERLEANFSRPQNRKGVSA